MSKLGSSIITEARRKASNGEQPVKQTHRH